MESTDDSSTCSQHLNLPPGFRFHPTDEELVVHYLKKKAISTPLPVTIIADIDLYKFDPWELPSKAAFGEQEWYFFSPRDRKYPNGSRPNRAATSGYWKATGTDKPILSSNEAREKLGVKKALVFYRGKPPKGVKTNWIMHEYRLADNNISSSKPPGTNPANIKNSLRLDDWVLCRIYKKSNSTTSTMEREIDDYVVNMCANRLVENQEEYKCYENGRMLMQSSPISQSSSMTSSSLGKSALSSSAHDQQWSLEDSPAWKRFRSNDYGNGMIMMDYGIDNNNRGGGGGGGGGGSGGGSFLSLLNDQFTHQNDSTQLIHQNTVFLGSNNIDECSLHHQSYQFS